MRCFAYSFNHSLHIQAIQQEFSSQYAIKRYPDALHLKSTADTGENAEGDVFLFPYGAMVSWGLTQAQETALCDRIAQFFKQKLGAIDDDLFSYGYAQQSGMVDDHISLSSQAVLHKLAFSYGLAQSAKLGGFEEGIEKLFMITKDLPETLAKEGQIKLSRREIRKLMGKIFVERASINLHIELLDAPNFFWEHTELEPLHEVVTEYLDQKHRVTLLNQRLAVMHELLEMLGSELNNQHSSKLEWIIIWLIFVEVSVMLAKEIFHIL